MPRFVIKCISLPLLLALFACNSPTAEKQPFNSSEFESFEITVENDEIIVAKISYYSEGLLIYGELCRSKGEGSYPLLVINHGGFSGIDDNFTGTACGTSPYNGVVVVLSSYRGEDGSEGQVEICKGEVNDVLTLTRIAKSLPYVNEEQTVMVGASHGGCITLMAVARGVNADAAAALVPPTDVARLYADWSAAVAANPESAESKVLSGLIARVEMSTGGTPEEVPLEYKVRSPVAFVDEINAWPGALFMMAGADDFIVPASQECSLAAQASGFESYRVVNTEGMVSTDAPAECVNEAIAWQPPPKPVKGWPQDRYFMFYEDMGHGFTGPLAGIAISDLIYFLNPYLYQELSRNLIFNNHK